MLKRGGKPEEARDFLWKELNRIKIENFNKFLEANISLLSSGADPYVEFYFEKVLNRLEIEQRLMFSATKMGTQNEIRMYSAVEKDFKTASLFNTLRNRTKEVNDFYKKRLNAILNVAMEDLNSIVSSPEELILKNKSEYYNELFARLPDEDPMIYKELGANASLNNEKRSQKVIVGKVEPD